MPSSANEDAAVHLSGVDVAAVVMHGGREEQGSLGLAHQHRIGGGLDVEVQQGRCPSIVRDEHAGGLDVPLSGFDRPAALPMGEVGDFMAGEQTNVLAVELLSQGVGQTRRVNRTF